MDPSAPSPPAEQDRLILRDATVEDAQDIGLLHRIGLQGVGPGHLPAAALAISAHDRAIEWREWLRAHTTGRAVGLVLVADARQGPVGFLCAVPARRPGATHWEVLHLYVLPAYQGQGLGGRLLAACLTRLRQSGCRRVECAVVATPRPDGLYERLGGVALGGEEADLYGSRLALVRYAFDLTPPPSQTPPSQTPPSQTPPEDPAP